MANSSGKSFWLHSKGFDLSFVSGGAFFTLLIAAVGILNPSMLPLFFWAWVVIFEGSHFFETWNRTYFDRDFRHHNRSVLVGSLIFFVLPAIFVLLRYTKGQAVITDIYGFFIFVWSLYHNARQHFGFQSIYNRKAQFDSILVKMNKWALYLVVGGAQLFYLTHIKIQNAFPIIPSVDQWYSGTSLIASFLPIIISSAGVILLSFTLVRAVLEKRSIIPIYYTTVCLIFYSVMFYLIAPLEPVFGQPASGAQKLMLITVMNSLFHNIQYHAIMWHYGKRRAKEESSSDQYGFAGMIYRNDVLFIVANLIGGLIFGFFVFQTGDWSTSFLPTPFGEFNPLAYIFILGTVGHHFYLDQVIWRPSTQKDLSAYLDLNTLENANEIDRSILSPHLVKE